MALAAAVAFAVANTSASIAYHSGTNPPTVAAIRFLLPTVSLVIWLRMRGVPIKLPFWQCGIAVGLGVITAIYTWALLSAISAIPLALAILVFYLFPIVATLMLAVCGWDKLGWQTIATTMLAFAGLALALNPRDSSVEFQGVLLALVGAVGLGVVIAVSSRVFGSGDSRPVTLYIAAIAATALIVICLAQGEWALPQAGFGWLGLLGTSISYAFAMIAFFIAISMIGPLRVSLLSYAEPVITAGLGVGLLGETLTPVQVMGIAIVVLALVGTTLRPSHAR